jgi:hypothetical protein
VSGIGENWFETFTQRPIGPKEFLAMDPQTLEKIKEFIEKNPAIIDQLSPESTNNLFSNLDGLLQENPSSKNTIVKIKHAFDGILIGKDIFQFLYKLNKYNHLNSDHLRDVTTHKVEVVASMVST